MDELRDACQQFGLTTLPLTVFQKYLEPPMRERQIDRLREALDVMGDNVKIVASDLLIYATFEANDEGILREVLSRNLPQDAIQSIFARLLEYRPWKPEEVQIYCTSYCDNKLLKLYIQERESFPLLFITKTFTNPVSVIENTRNTLYEECTRRIALLLQHGADINARNLDEPTPIHLAATRHAWEVVQMLLLWNANIDIKIGGITAREIIEREKPEFGIENYDEQIENITVKDKLYDALYKESEEEFMNLLVDNDNFDVNDHNGKETLLQLAIIKKFEESVGILLKRGADINLVAGLGIEPILLAFRNPELECLSQLWKFKASINYKISHMSGTILHELDTLTLENVEKQRGPIKNIIEDVVSQNVNVQAVDHVGSTALHRIANQGPKGYSLMCELLRFFIPNFDKSLLQIIPPQVFQQFFDQRVEYIDHVDSGMIRINYGFIRPKVIEIGGEVVGVMDGEVVGEMNGEVDGVMDGELVGEMNVEVVGEINGEVDGEMNGEVDGEIHVGMDGEIVGEMNVEVDGEMNGEVVGEIHVGMDGEVDGEMNGEIHVGMDGEIVPEMILFYEMSKIPEYSRTVLLHPIVKLFLIYKWRKIAFIFFLNFILYVLFTIFLSIHAYQTVSSENVSEILQGNLTQTSNHTPSQFGLCFIIGITLWFIIFLSEGFQLVKSCRSYVWNWENLFEILLLLFSLLTYLPTFWDSSLIKAVVIILAYMELTLLVRRYPSDIGIYITMFTRVTLKSSIVIITFAAFIFSFAFSFFIMLRETEIDKESYDSLWDTTIRTWGMAIGELNLSVLKKFNSIGGGLILLLFVLLVTIVFMNLLNALAISDTQTIINETQAICCVANIEYYTRIEAIFLGYDPEKLNIQEYCENSIESNRTFKTWFLVLPLNSFNGYDTNFLDITVEKNCFSPILHNAPVSFPPCMKQLYVWLQHFYYRKLLHCDEDTILKQILTSKKYPELSTDCPLYAEKLQKGIIHHQEDLQSLLSESEKWKQELTFQINKKFTSNTEVQIEIIQKQDDLSVAMQEQILALKNEMQQIKLEQISQIEDIHRDLRNVEDQISKISSSLNEMLSCQQQLKDFVVNALGRGNVPP